MIFRPRDRDALLVSLLLPLTTFAILCYEIVLTRLFAFVFTYDLTAMAVSFAIFGLGAGAYVRVRWLCLLPQRPLAVVAHLASTVSLLALYVLLLFTHATAAVIFVSAMPFAVAGVAVSHYYEVRRAHRAAATYALDLSGAAAACVASAVLLVGLGVDGALLFLAGLSVGGPTYVLCVLLFALLLYCGLGSLVSARFARGVRPRLGSYAIVVAVVGVVTAELIERCYRLDGVSSTVLRVACVLALVAPIGLSLGAPFPDLLRRYARSDDRRVAYLWAVNGVGSVLGAGLTLMLSLVLGGHLVLLAGSALYLLAWTIDRREAIEG